MKNTNIKTGALAGVMAIILPLLQVTGVSAWGPERPTYTNEKPADHAVFNSITNNAAVGDERDFVRIEEKNSGREYSSEIIIEPGKQYEVYIYYHNDASETYNDKAHDYVGIAFDTRLASSFPQKLAKNERGAVTGRITSSTTDPEAVWDEAYVTAKEAVTLHYVTGSAKIYNQWPVNGSVLSTNLFSSQGTFIGLDELNGGIKGCDRYSGQVVYTIQTVADGEPVPDDTEPVPETPIEPTTPNTPVVPDELPSTGPMEITLAVVVVLLLVALVWYWLKTKKAVKRTKHSVKGKK